MPLVKSLSNKYYVWLKRDQEPLPWNPADAELNFEHEGATYFGKVFEIVERNLDVGGLTFYFTRDLEQLPSYGQNVVVIVLGDEWSRVPKYFYKVRAIFKTLTTQPMLGCNPLLQPSYLNSLTLLQFLRIWAIRLPGLLNYTLYKLKSSRSGIAKIPPTYDVPLGYNEQLEIPIKDLKDRLYDISFNGSVEHTTYPIWSLKRWISTPKTVSRRNMTSSLIKFKEKYPNFKIDLILTPGFHTTERLSKREYSEKMMNTRICLVPRGTSFETFRFFEGLRYGCVLVTESLPKRWFYEGIPAIQLKDWNELQEKLKHLLENKSLMEKMHEDSLKFWQEKCSEVAIGKYIAQKLNSLN